MPSGTSIEIFRCVPISGIAQADRMIQSGMELVLRIAAQLGHAYSSSCQRSRIFSYRRSEGKEQRPWRHAIAIRFLFHFKTNAAIGLADCKLALGKTALLDWTMIQLQCAPSLLVR